MSPDEEHEVDQQAHVGGLGPRLGAIAGVRVPPLAAIVAVVFAIALIGAGGYALARHLGPTSRAGTAAVQDRGASGSSACPMSPGASQAGCQATGYLPCSPAGAGDAVCVAPAPRACGPVSPATYCPASPNAGGTNCATGLGTAPCATGGCAAAPCPAPPPSCPPGYACAVSGSPATTGTPIPAGTPAPCRGCPPPAPSPTSSPAPQCATAEVSTTLVTDKPSYSAGQKVNFSITVKNISNHACSVSRMGGCQVGPTIYDSQGHVVWPTGPQPMCASMFQPVTLQPGQSDTVTAAWSQQTCSGNNCTQVPAGTYTARWSYTAPASASFKIG